MLALKVNHIILRPHPNDINIFEEVLEKLSGYLKQFDNWYYIIEKDGTSQRHCHIIVNHNFDRIDNKLRKLKQFISDSIEGKSSLLNRFMVNKEAKTEHDKRMVYGYVGKDISEENRTEASCSEILYLIEENIKYYSENSIKIKNKNFKDIIIVKTTTAVCQILNYLNDNNLELDPTIFDKMTHDHGYSFVCMSVKNKRDVYLELKNHLGIQTAQDKSEAMCQWIHNPDDQNLMGELLYAKETKQFHIIQGWYNN